MYTSKKIWVYASLIRYLSRSYAKQSERIKKMMIIHNWNPVFRHYGYLPKYMDIFSWVFSSMCPFSCEYFPWHLNICTWLFPFQFISVPCGYAHQNFLPEVCVRHWCVMVKCLPHRVREGQVFFFNGSGISVYSYGQISQTEPCPFSQKREHKHWLEYPLARRSLVGSWIITTDSQDLDIFSWTTI